MSGGCLPAASDYAAWADGHAARLFGQPRDTERPDDWLRGWDSTDEMVRRGLLEPFVDED